MKTLAADLSYLKQGIAELDDYLNSREVFWQLSRKRGSGSDDLPLTIGNLLFCVKKLLGHCCRDQEREEVEQLVVMLHAIRRDRKSAWIIKSAAEFRKRLSSWKANLEEHLSGAGQTSFPVIVRERVLLELLRTELDNESKTVITLREKLPVMESLISQLNLLDQKLKFESTPGKFVWDADLEEIFPPQPNWYLYLDIKQ